MHKETLEQNIATVTSGLLPIEVKPHIKNNLNPKFELRPYQIEALSRFDFYLNHNPNRNRPTQLLFHMATGSGKTLVMAGVILGLYERGYRNFIFFVNSSNIIEKTRDNFLNSLSSKYLFNETLSMVSKKISIKEVGNFEIANQEDINIVFTTIQGLHTRLNTPKENSLTYEDFDEKRIVLLSDEAHHINAETKKGKQTKDEVESIVSWESTVDKIFNANTENLLLEFTATANLQHPEVAKKYHDKLLFDYPLKQFRKDKYSKEVHVLQAELSPFERALQAIILNQYRKKIFEKNRLHVKPVVLLKSKTISDSKLFFDEFINGIKTLTPPRIKKISNNSTNTVIFKTFNYFDSHDISIDNLISELQEDFSESKCISVDSKNDSIEKQLIINSLEDGDNEYRAVFAVDKLNEGWDVLNLFDIVRLYDTKKTEHKGGKIGNTTMSEAQLIGRGARYCPFRLDENQPLFQRKYDDAENELRICEELFYHAAHNPKYIAELNKALQTIGLKATPEELKKKSTVEKTRGKFIKIQTKEQLNQFKLDKSIREKIYKKKFNTGHSSISQVFGNNLQTTASTSVQIYNLKSFGIPILRKALNRLPFYRFSNLKKRFPHLSSISEFLASDEFANNIKVEIEGTTEQVAKPNNQMKLEIALDVFDEISKAIA